MKKIWLRGCCAWIFSWSRAGLDDLWGDFLAYMIWGEVLASAACCGVLVEGDKHCDKKGHHWIVFSFS